MRDALVAAAMAALVLVATPALAQQPADPPAGDPVDLGLYGAPIRFTAPNGVVVELGTGRRLVDTVEVRPSPVGDGVLVVAEMDIDEYVAGLAEMPASWPMEALRAQAVAARTYAWYQRSLQTYEDRGLPYDICATTACQVFEGRAVVEGDKGQRWQRAVDQTSGQVLLHGGEPILARYFSTSGGATRNNEHVFPSDGAFPYLKGVEDPDDALSPLHTWTARFTREQFDAIAARGQTLSAVTPVAQARVERAPGGEPDRVVITGRDGTTAEVTAGELQNFLNSTAPELFPEQFPGPRSEGDAPLPTTVPSSRYRIEVTDQHVVLHGRGWGHGVGMGQYGARGKAERGLDHAEILAAYYNGLRPTRSPDVPERIRVGLADDVGDLSMSANGPLVVRAAGHVVTRRALGMWRVAGAPDDTARLVAPAGYGAPLVVDPTTASRTRPYPVEAIELETVVNKPAELVVEVRRGDEVVGRRPVGVVEAGRHRVTWDLDMPGGSVEPGPHRVRLLAIDEEGERAGSAVDVEVLRLPDDDGPAPSVLPAATSLPLPGTPWGAVAVAGLAGLAVGGLLGRRGRHG